MAETLSAQPAAAPPRPGFRDLLTNRDFRLLWAAYAATGTADFFTYAAVALGLVGGLFMPARGSALPAVVGKEMLEAGNGVLQVTQQVAGVLGPVAAGAMVAWRGSGAAFLFDAVAYAVAVACVALMRG